MTQTKRRYTTVDGKNDFLVTVAFDTMGLDKAHWFEAHVSAHNERTDDKVKFPPELRTYRIGEIEHSFGEYVKLDFGGDRDAALSHHLDTIFRRVYSFIERGH